MTTGESIEDADKASKEAENTMWKGWSQFLAPPFHWRVRMTLQCHLHAVGKKVSVPHCIRLHFPQDLYLAI